jgi:hypothetical protein
MHAAGEISWLMEIGCSAQEVDGCKRGHVLLFLSRDDESCHLDLFVRDYFVASQVSTKNGENSASYVKLNEELSWNFRNEVKTMGKEVAIFCSLDRNDWSHSLDR